MARPKGRRQALTTPEAMAGALPERFLQPNLGENPVEALRTYLYELTQWVIEQGAPPQRAPLVAVQVAALVGAAPSDWYRVVFDRPVG
jgi:hypothetical protein